MVSGAESAPPALPAPPARNSEQRPGIPSSKVSTGGERGVTAGGVKLGWAGCGEIGKENSMNNARPGVVLMIELDLDLIGFLVPCTGWETVWFGED